MDSSVMALILFFIGVHNGTCQSSTCHAQCDYDHVTARTDCSFRNLTCIPVNYPDSLIMDLSHNNISVLDDFSAGIFTRLVELYLDYNDIRRFSISVHETPFPSLISSQFNRIRNVRLHYHYSTRSSEPLDLKLDNNEIDSVDTEVYFNGDIKNVFKLSLSHNRLRYFRSTAVWEEVNMSSNGLRVWERISYFIEGRARIDLMQKLDISNNSFDSLIQPGWAEGLQILYADDNILANLSSTTLQGFTNLTELHLANNRLVFISSTALSQLTKLRSLYLDGNALTSLFGGIFLNQADLVEISIINNHLCDLHPDYFLGLDSLERLHLAGNRLVYVKSEMFRQMPGLVTMDFSKNTINVFDITNCSLLINLQNVLLAHNSIHDISYILGHCDNFEVLDLSFNQIRVVPGDSLTVGGRSRALSRLELEGNPLQCDCRLTGLRDWLLNNPPSVLPRCQGPPQNSGAVVTDLDIPDFICDPPKAVSKVNHLNVIVGQAATLSCTATGIPIPNITWLNPNSTVIPDKWQDRYFFSRGMTLHIISVELSDRGMYTCLVQNILGEFDRAVVNLTVSAELKSTHASVSLAAAVLPTMFITLIVTLAFVALVISLRRRYKKKDHCTSAVEGVRGGSRLSVGFRKTVSTRSDEGYVNEPIEGEYMTPTCKEDTGEEYEVPSTAAGHPSGRYQRHLWVIPSAGMDDADVYEPVNIGGET
ncbi:leucine-rich repeats and immunoglobulin-like domains protein 2 [Patiria miniata]|uniref:Ig-like domain-containing protein n=1 Tax=Patiria miniata TaxID=46514 RepID=A0A914AUC5_PATMI|nr:leucine-rich repeats and immunoglobulin-like domains protein 2 [Patiria miniata]